MFFAFHVGWCDNGDVLFNRRCIPFVHHGSIRRFALRPDLVRSNLSSNYRFAEVFVSFLLDDILMGSASVTRAIVRVVAASALSRPLFFNGNGGCDCDGSDWNR
jgi:hypothetical protein